MTDRVGQQLGHYRLLRLLGRGAFAAVYLGEHQYLERLAAVKVLHVRMEPDTHQSFRHEARTIAQLHHPHIIDIYDFGFEDQTPYLVMEYTPNGTLRSQYPKGTHLPFEQIVTYVKQIASALDYAHEQFVIHRDVKPENILLDANHKVVLSDFGIAVVQHTLDSLSTQHPAGTSLYMAPEQIQYKACAASDQYSLGVMVYEWLCGEPPFRGSLYEVLSQHLYKAPPSLRARLPQLPPAAEDAVFGTLAKDPQRRFPTVQDFATVLAEAFLTTQTLSPSKSAEYEGQKETKNSPARVRLVPISSASEEDYSDERTQPRLKAVQPIEEQPELLSSVSPQPTTYNQSTTERHLPPRHQQAPPSALQNQNRARMLRRLRHSYSNLMSQSLQGATWLELDLADKPDAVQNAAHLSLYMSSGTEELLPAGASITQTYDEAEHELLILGNPGSGKSTLLLNLAQQLVLRAEQDQTHPLAVILPLSSWAVKRLPLEDWIAEQLVEIYDVPRKLSTQWMQEGGILPLLDGLDEMEEGARASCIAAINTYHRDRLAELVVCSRTSEYEAAAEDHRLALQGAVVVQPLTHEDVDAYLLRAGQPLTALRSALQQNATLHDLATTPLMLNILILTYQGSSVRDLSKREPLLQKLVWDDYVQRMVTRKGNSKRYPLPQTRAWLSYLAQQMREHNQTVFYLEHLQPDWLETKQHRTYTRLAVRLPAIFIGVLVSILVFLFFFGGTYLSNLPSFFMYAVLGGLLGGLWRGSMPEKGSQGERRHAWGKRLVKRLVISACFGLIYGVAFIFYLSSHTHYTPDQQQVYGLVYGAVMGLSSLLLQYLLTSSFRSGTSSGNSASQHWTRAGRFFQAMQGPRALLVAIVIGLSDALTLGPILQPRFWLSIIGLSIWLYYGLSCGLIYGLVSLALGTQMEGIRPTERLKWTWRNLGRGLFNSRHLRISVLLGCISMIIVALDAGPSQGLGGGLTIGLSYWCLLGFFQGITQEQIENQDRRITNQGIRRSLRNSVIMGSIGGAMIGSIGILSYLLNNVLSSLLSYEQKGALISDLSTRLPSILLLGISGALLIYLLNGGLAALRHYIIRFLLRRSRTFPGAASQFLDDATARFLLRRVGGGYSFTHRLLLDYFADLQPHNARL